MDVEKIKQWIKENDSDDKSRADLYSEFLRRKDKDGKYIVPFEFAFEDKYVKKLEDLFDLKDKDRSFPKTDYYKGLKEGLEKGWEGQRKYYAALVQDLMEEVIELKQYKNS